MDLSFGSMFSNSAWQDQRQNLRFSVELGGIEGLLLKLSKTKSGLAIAL